MNTHMRACKYTYRHIRGCRAPQWICSSVILNLQKSNSIKKYISVLYKLSCFRDFLIVMKLIMKKGYAETPFKIGQFGGCYETLRQVVQSVLTCTLQARHWKLLRFGGPLIICQHVTLRGHCDHIVQACLVKSSVALGLDFCNPLIGKCTRDNTGQERGTSFSTHVNDLLLVRHLGSRNAKTHSNELLCIFISRGRNRE